MRAFMTALARIMAILGGIILTVLVILTCISVLGRGLNTLGHSDLMEGLAPGFAAWLIGTGVGPLSGDFELVQAGMAFAIFAFLPICQLHGAHATVDVFTNSLPARTNAWLTAFWEVCMAIVVVIIAWRLFFGLENKYSTGQTTFLLQFPVWWTYTAAFLAALVAAAVGIYTALGRVMETVGSPGWLPSQEEADH